MSENKRYIKIKPETKKIIHNSLQNSTSNINPKNIPLNNLTSKLTNTINSKGFFALNHKGKITTKDILSSYEQKLLKEAWIQFSNYIRKNYEKGKGTFIKGFGTFTFLSPEINLEGTTNQYERDIKLRRPIFIVSKEFYESLRPGYFCKDNGLMPITHKENNGVNINKFNYSEIAFALNISKDECYQIFKYIIYDMREQIKKNKFFSRELPGIGFILIKDNIFGIKFNDSFTTEIYKKTEKLKLTKKNLNLCMDTYKANQTICNIKNVDKSINELFSKVSPITHLTKHAENWLEKSMEIKPNQYDDNKEDKKNFNKIKNYNTSNLWNSQTFFKAPSHKRFLIKNKSKELLDQNDDNNKQNNDNFNVNKIPKEIQKAIVANKGQLIKELKNYDRRINGLISRFEAVRAFQKCNIHPQLTMNIINDIINCYSNNKDFIDYNKLITLLIKEIKYNFRNSSFCDEDNNLLTSFNEKFRFGPKRSDNFILQRKLNLNKGNISLKKNSNILKMKTIYENEKKDIIENSKDSNLDDYNFLNVKVSEVEKEILSIKLILDDAIVQKKKLMNSLKLEKFMENDQEINYKDFIQLLRVYSITYPINKILKILKFIGIENPQKMTLNLLNKKFLECNVSSSEMNNSDLEAAINDILLDDKLNIKCILFNEKKEITQNDFVYLLHDKTKFTDNILKEVFQRISNKNIYLSYDDLTNIINNQKNEKNKVYNEKFYIESCNRILGKIKSLNISGDEYFEKLLRYNYIRRNNMLSKTDFILSMQQEDYEPRFIEKELSFIYDQMKNNKTGDLDRYEFKKAIYREYNALYKFHDDIKKMKMTIKELAFIMGFANEKEYSRNINFWEFKLTMKKLNSHYSNEFIESLYIELVGDLEKNINIKFLLDSINVYKKNEFNKINNESFIKNVINIIQNKVDYHTLKSSFENEDKNLSGKISKETFYNIVNKFIKDFNEEDLMKLIRITKISENATNEVEYIKFINMVYYNQNLDSFLLCVNELNEIFIHEANKNLNILIAIINGTKSDINTPDYITTDKLYLFLSERINKKFENSYIKLAEPITKTIICKFDVDSDGKVSLEDLKSILLRYSNTDFFKYENNSKNQNVNLFAQDILTDDEYKSIVRRMKENMKKKNITDAGLFKKLDENKDGFINNYEFSKNIKDVIDLNPSTADKFFNYLDGYSNGMVDLDTFLLRFKEFKLDKLLENNNKIENIIVDKLTSFILKNNENFNNSEIFCLIDKDGDGIISLDDFKNFVINELGISKNRLTDSKLERVMQTISLSKNTNISLADLNELIEKILSKKNNNSCYIDLKESFKEINNLNLSKNKKNKDWINQLIEKLGMYISEKYENIKTFYDLYANLKENKLRFEDFNKFLEKDIDCFQGFSLTKDEYLSLFSSLDSQKKNYLTLDDLVNKLEIFDFYKKMHLDIKNFLNNYFEHQIDAFNYFLPSEIDSAPLTQRNNNSINNDSDVGIINKNNDTKGITKKQFYDGINNLFPGKYSNETLLKYIKKYFNLENDENKKDNEKKEYKLITFSYFSFLYYGVVCSDQEFKNKNRVNKITSTRNSIVKIYSKKFNKLSKSKSIGRLNSRHNLFRNEEEIFGPHPKNHLDHPFKFLAHENLITPFDKNPLNKIKRILASTPNVNYKKNLNDFVNKFRYQNYICNEFQFRNLVRQLNIGLTNIEIEDILKNSGKTYNGLINIKEFYKYITGKDKIKNTIDKNISIILSEFKQLLYKYYSNPKLAFIFHDKGKTNRMDFTKFKNIIIELYSKEQKPVPNFVILKNCYDYIDLRKDGVIDLVEWCNVFSKVTGQLDYFKGLENKKGFKELKKWEMSNNIIDIYKNIYKNRKIISLSAKSLCYGSFIQEDNLINILKENFPNYKFTNTQWRIIVEIGTKDTKGFINFDYFLNIVESCAKREEMPRI